MGQTGSDLCAKMGGFINIKEDVRELNRKVELLQGLNQKIEYSHEMLKDTVKTLEEAKKKIEDKI